MGKSNKVIILGTTMFSSQLFELLREEGIEIIGYTVDKEYLSVESLHGLPVFPFEELETFTNLNNVSILNSIGYLRMNDVRNQKYLECKHRGFGIYTFISKHAQVYTNDIDEGSIVMPGSYVGPFSKIGKCSVVWPGSVISHHNIIGDNCWIAPSCCVGGGSRVNKNCFLGLGCTIRNEIELADYTFVGAHSYIEKDTIKGCSYIGVPARRLVGKDSYEIVARV